jgi:hypothetical protein
MMLAASRGQEARASELIEAALWGATAGGLGRMDNFADYATRCSTTASVATTPRVTPPGGYARDRLLAGICRDRLGHGPYVVAELAEAASRTGDMALVRAALDWLSDRTRVTPTEWSLGIEARVRALLSHGDVAERLYRESIARLGRTRVRVELARAHHQPAHGQVPPAQGLHQARYHLADPARPRPAQRPDRRPATLATPFSLRG